MTRTHLITIACALAALVLVCDFAGIVIESAHARAEWRE